MRSVLHTYQLRLTNLSQSNRALRLAKLSALRDVDLCSLGFIEKDSPAEMLRKVLAGKDLRLLSAPDPRFAPANVAGQQLNKIWRTVQTLFEETGAYDLYLGYPFVEGRFLDGTLARCPVLLFPVRLTRNLQGQPRWSLDMLDEPVVFNKTFFLAYEHFNQMRLPAAFWEEEMPPSEDWGLWLTALHQKIKAYELSLNVNPRLFDLQVEPFPDLGKAQMEAFKPGVLTFQPYAVLGLFPQSDSALLNDYETIAQNPAAFDLDTLLGGGKTSSLPPAVLAGSESEAPPYIREEDRYFVTPVDASQEQALLLAQQGQSLVVYGPPGTGKSQVIVNLIADAMAHHKKVLLVSQKRAALDVVHKRLDALGLARFSVRVHDYRHDRAEIYAQIRRQIDDLELFQKETQDLDLTHWEHTYKLLSRQADQLGRKFEDLCAALTSRRACGLSVHELYLRTRSDMALLPLADYARQSDLPRLQQFMSRLRALLDYREFLAADYPWRERLSFRHHSPEDRQRLRDLLLGAGPQVAELNRRYLRLKASLGSEVLDEAYSREGALRFREAERMLAQAPLREGVEMLYRSAAKPAALRDHLADIETALRNMDKRQFLQDEDWKRYEDLIRHAEVYKKQEKQGMRVFSLSWQRARWFWSRILKRSGAELSDTSFAALRKEVAVFQRLHQLYARTYEQEFYADFPLLASQADKWAWYQEKEACRAAYLHLRGLKHFPKVRPRFEGGYFDAEGWERTRTLLGELEAFNQLQRDRMQVWRQWLSEAQVEPLRSGIAQPEEAQAWLEALVSALDRDFHDLQQLDRLLADHSAAETAALEVLAPELAGDLPPETLLLQVTNSVFHAWIAQAERADPLLAEVSTRSWPRVQEEYAEKLAERRQRVTELVLRRIKEKLVSIVQYNRLNNPVTFREIYHQVGKKRLIWSVRKLVQECWEQGLRELVPCWMASPESAAAIFPMQAGMFDLVIFDEASQCFVERALPVLLRGKQFVVAGDEKQLQPSDLYRVRAGEEDAELSGSNSVLEVQSVLDLARGIGRAAHLNWHYRSRHSELIRFSNEHFYEGRLQMMPSARPSEGESPLRWVSVEGQWRQNRNLPEAQQVIAELLACIRRPDRPSLGIVTFNYHQQELIRDLLDETAERLAHEDPDLYLLLQQSLTHTENGEFLGLFVKNIENVQGDERDVILFSVGYARNEEGRLQANFGPLNLMGGENRLNVAITRARRQVIVVCSFDPAELKVEDSQHPGPQYLRDYLQYVKRLSGKRAIQEDPLRLPVASSSEIHTYLSKVLTEQGFELRQDLGDSFWKLDMAIRLPGQEGFALGIEIEGSRYFNASGPKEREVYRREALMARGWRVYRVWARNFWMNPVAEAERIVALARASVKN
ncbi:MAG: DUF4011 domain-containing protein [Bacteroidetes bacterium]|nr:MAG: DUF4011 domain-containing protein [Bacteroidota bacterium]